MKLAQTLENEDQFLDLRHFSVTKNKRKTAVTNILWNTIVPYCWNIKFFISNYICKKNTGNRCVCFIQAYLEFTLQSKRFLFTRELVHMRINTTSSCYPIKEDISPNTFHVSRAQLVASLIPCYSDNLLDYVEEDITRSVSYVPVTC